MPENLALVNGWENFYVITGSSAAGLTGLTFVVIALASDAKMVHLSGLRAFITPIVIHFSSVLWIACLMSVPGHTALSLAISIAVTGVAVTIYSLMTIVRMLRFQEYRPAGEDWIWNAILPALSCLSLLAAAKLVSQHPSLSLYIVGGVTLAMLVIGIHNAWDLAVWITAERPGAQKPPTEKPTDTP
jgi:hypothetical protein